MKVCKILAAAAALALLSACGGESETAVRRLSEETETTTYKTVSGAYTGETNIDVSLPGGSWEITADNADSTVFVQGDKTITAAVIDDSTFDTGSLPVTKDEIISRYTTAGGSNIDVLEFSYEETENGTNMLRYTIKYTGSEGVKTLITATEIIDVHKAVVVDGVIDGDADDAEISMMREAVDAAETVKSTE